MLAEGGHMYQGANPSGQGMDTNGEPVVPDITDPRYIGGNTDGLTYPSFNSPFTDVDDQTWLNWWYRNRQKQLKSNALAYDMAPRYDKNGNKRNAPNLFDGKSDYFISTKIKSNLGDAIDMSLNTPIQWENRLPGTAAGQYKPEDHSIHVLKSASDLPSVILHERVHGITDNLSNVLSKGDNAIGQRLSENDGVLSKRIGPTNFILHAIHDDGILAPTYPQIPNGYWDNTNEIYSRLMQFRRKFKLLPSKEYTQDDIDRWRKDGSLRKYSLDAYSDFDLLRLFNKVASTNERKIDNLG